MTNRRLVFGASSLFILALAGVPGCSDAVTLRTIGDAGAPSDAGAGSSEAGAAGSGETAGTGGTSGGAGAGGDTSELAGAGGEGGAVELTQAELCETFCLDEAAACTDGLSEYTGLEDCAAACNQFARGTAGDTEGDTLECRIYHVNAAKLDPVVHCAHIGANPTAGCNPAE